MGLSQRDLDVLHYMLRKGGPSSCIEIARDLDIPQPAAYRTLYKMMENSIVNRKPKPDHLFFSTPGQYELTGKGISLLTHTLKSSES